MKEFKVGVLCTFGTWIQVSAENEQDAVEQVEEMITKKNLDFTQNWEPVADEPEIDVIYDLEEDGDPEE